MENIDKKIAWLLEVNRKNSEKYIKDELPRRFYEAEHNTQILALKCMDGRVNISLVTGTPLGIIKPYRNIGGRFNMGWPMLGADIQEVIEKAVSIGKKSLVIINYHYSKGDKHRGCAGFGYDHDASLLFTLNLHKQFNRIFGENNGVVFPVVIGLETDTNALILHSQNPSDKNVLYLSEETNEDKNYLMSLINGLYPDMDVVVKNDLLPLVQGNITHIKDIKSLNRHLDDLKHKEWVLGIGRGFDWLHEPNTALLVGPFNPELSNPLIKAIGIIKDNMESGRIGKDGFLVLSSAVFEKHGNDRNRAIEKTNFFSSEVRNIIENNYPELLPKARFMRVVVDENTRRMEQVPEIITGL